MYHTTKIVFLSLSVLYFWGGCANFKQPRNQVQHYTLEYTSPEIEGLTPLPVSIKVDRFSVAPAYNSNRIIYRDASFKRDEYFYHKWRANPGDMVADFMGRDIRNSGLFKAVLTHESGFPFSCVLEGSVDEFVEWDAPEGWKAVLSVTVTLMTTNEPDVSKRILFQKTYREEEPFMEKNPQGLAQAMSVAMRDISTSAIRDIYSVLAK
ncbi:MAG: ABC-type transport auxiliary lipoprotein family protein [Candidatus Desulfacyla sp.]